MPGLSRLHASIVTRSQPMLGLLEDDVSSSSIFYKDPQHINAGTITVASKTNCGPSIRVLLVTRNRNISMSGLSQLQARLNAVHPFVSSLRTISCPLLFSMRTCNISMLGLSRQSESQSVHSCPFRGRYLVLLQFLQEIATNQCWNHHGFRQGEAQSIHSSPSPLSEKTATY